MNKQREIITLERQGTQQQKPQSPTVTPPGMRVNTTCICDAYTLRYRFLILQFEQCRCFKVRHSGHKDQKSRPCIYCRVLRFCLFIFFFLFLLVHASGWADYTYCSIHGGRGRILVRFHCLITIRRDFVA